MTAVFVEIVLTTTGGFIGTLFGPVRLDTALLDATTAEQLESLVRDAQFFDQPHRAPAPQPGAADYQTYRITVRDGGRSHEIEVTDPIEDDHVARLIVAVEALRPTSRPGGE